MTVRLFFIPRRILVPFLSCLPNLTAGEELKPFLGPIDDRFSREECYARVLQYLQDSVLAANDTAFYHDDLGFHSSLNRPVLNLKGCNELCGRKFGWYKDIGPRLSTWLIPVFLLLSNMEVSPLDKRRYLMIVHLLGDPIDSLWSMLTKLEAWSRCHYLAIELCESKDEAEIRQNATVLGGFEELVGFSENPVKMYSRIRKRSRISQAAFQNLVCSTAQRLADSRSDERLRTLFATLLYCYQLLAAFVAIIGGGNTTPPGGRIGLTMFMTWIVPSILISNAMGGYMSRRTCYDIMEAFVEEATERANGWHTLQRIAPNLRQYDSTHDYMANLAWSGAIYTYRPSKHIPFRAKSHNRSAWTLFLLAAAPVVTSSIISSVILWNTPPIGINCRNILIFVITGFVFFSVAFTHITAYFISGRRHWYLVLVKDALIAVPAVVLVFIACAGRFNTCWCWSGGFSLGAKARVILNAAPDFIKYNKKTYPILVSVCLLIQCLAFVLMMWLGWRGWNVIRWSEKQKIEGWSMSRCGKVNEEAVVEEIELKNIVHARETKTLLDTGESSRR